MNRPLLIVVSAPSGAGKTTLCDRLLEARDDVIYSVSCTTRVPRGQEKDGVDYHFLADEEFTRRAAKGEFLEHAVVHGHRYGTLRATVEGALGQGQSVLMDIDVQGAAQVREQVKKRDSDDLLRRGFVDVFIAPPSLEELHVRLVERGEDSAEVIAHRMQNAKGEMGHTESYMYRIVNDNLDKAYAELVDVLETEAQKS